MNLVHALPVNHHQRSPTHRMDSCTSLQSPSFIALTTHTAVFTDYTADHTNHSGFINHGLPLARCLVLYCVYHSHSDSYSTEPKPLSCLALPCLFSCVLTPAHVLWIYPFALPFGLCLNLARIIALVPGLPLLSSPLDIVCRSPTTPVYLSTLLSCPLYTCLLFVRPCLLLTMPRNKSLHMDPLASRLVRPVTRILVQTGTQQLL